jgi:uncharacterized membrane protein YgcG
MTRRAVRAAVTVLAAALLGLVFGLPRAVDPLATPDRPDTLFFDPQGLVSTDFARETERWLHAIGLFEGLIVIGEPPPAGVDLAAWASTTASRWGVGTARQDRGLVLFVFPTEQRVRVEAGYGLEGRLPDLRLRALLETTVVPAFSKGDYEQGIERFVQTVYDGLGGDAEAARAALEAADRPRRSAWQNWTEIWDDAWQHGPRMLESAWRAFRQGTFGERLVILAFAAGPVAAALAGAAAAWSTAVAAWRVLRGLAKPRPARTAPLPWPLVAMGPPIVALCVAVVVFALALAPESPKRQGRFGGAGASVSWTAG